MLLNPQQFNVGPSQRKKSIRKGGFLPIICLSKINNYSFIQEHLTRRSKSCKYDLFSLKKVLFICLLFVYLTLFNAIATKEFNFNTLVLWSYGDARKHWKKNHLFAVKHKQQQKSVKIIKRVTSWGFWEVSTVERFSNFQINILDVNF